MKDYKPYSSVPKEPGRWRAITLAAAVHIALLVFFWIGIDWQNEPPVAVQAEIWDLQAREAAPLPPEPKPQPQPEPKPVVKEPPKAEPDEPPPPKVDIALEKEKKRKEQERIDKLAQQEKDKKQKADQEKLQKQADEKKEKADLQKKADLEKKKKQDALDAKLRDQVRAEEMKRLTGTVGSGGTGQAEKSQGSGRADASYVQKIASLIRNKMNFPDTSGTNLNVDYAISLFPDGSIRGEPKILKTSGEPRFDDAVLQAIKSAAPFPADKSGARPSGIHGNYKLKE